MLRDGPQVPMPRVISTTGASNAAYYLPKKIATMIDRRLRSGDALFKRRRWCVCDKQRAVRVPYFAWVFLSLVFLTKIKRNQKFLPNVNSRISSSNLENKRAIIAL